MLQTLRGAVRLIEFWPIFSKLFAAFFLCFAVTALAFTDCAFAFSAGDRVKATDNLNVRSCASTSCQLLTTESVDSRGTISSGPASGSGFTWWNINWDNGFSGWSVQDYLAAVPPVAPTPSNPSGGQVISTLTPTLIWSGGSNFNSLQINVSKSPYGGCPGGPNCVFTSAWLSAGMPAITLPAGALAAGTAYRWDVTACSGANGTGTCASSGDAYFSTQQINSDLIPENISLSSTTLTPGRASP
jgi:hypothetical protein